MVEAFLEKHGIDGKIIKKLEGYDSLNYLIDAGGQKSVLKIYEGLEQLPIIQEEQAFINEISEWNDLDLPLTPNKLAFQQIGNKFSRLIQFVDGHFLAETAHSPELIKSFGQKVAQLHFSKISNHYYALKSKKHSWDLQHALMSLDKIRFITDASKRKVVHFFLDKFEKEVLPHQYSLPTQFIHSDLNDWNILCQDGKISGLIDFGDMAYSWRINDIAIALCYIMFKKQDPLKIAIQFLQAYTKHNNLSKLELELLHYLIPTRLCVSVTHSAEKKVQEKHTEYTSISEADAWDLLHFWLKLNPIESQRKFLTAGGFQIGQTDNTNKIIQSRKKFAAESLSLSYNKPIYMHSSAFQYMYAKTGETFLDAYNNIPHVGHAHPKITRAVQQQISQLNTNTRYLYDQYSSYSEKLLDKFDYPLSKVLFVNSGSAASDLAIRMAKQFTDRQCQLVLGSGYHGNTQSTINISHYKFNGKGGQGRKEDVFVLDLPKTYNSKYDNGKAYAEEAITQVQSLIDQGNKPAFLIAEAISGCGGQVPVSSEYLLIIAAFLKANDIMLIIDEVQTGFGRMGSTFWAYQLSEINPDIVVLGKPMANGHPMGAVVTRHEITEAFNNGMEFFSSFGGNPVSCTIGQTVLEVIEEEGLQKNALEVGDYFQMCFKELQSTYSSIGDIRGSGLFIGVELIDPPSRKEDTALAHYLKNGMREMRVLTSTDGPFNNVIKIKPPLCFNKSNVDEYIDKFAELLKTKH